MQALSYMPFATSLFRFFTPKSLIEAKKSHHAMTTAKVRLRLKNKEEKNDFLGCVLKRIKAGWGMSVQEIIVHSAVLVLAGTETTATVLSGVTYLLLRDRRVLDKVVEEVRCAFEREEDITMKKTKKLVYLEACLNEAMRIYPPAP